MATTVADVGEDEGLRVERAAKQHMTAVYGTRDALKRWAITITADELKPVVCGIGKGGPGEDHDVVYDAALDDFISNLRKSGVRL